MRAPIYKYEIFLYSPKYQILPCIQIQDPEWDK